MLHDPDARLDYPVSWEALPDSDEFVDLTIKTADAVVVEDVAFAGKDGVAWISLADPDASRRKKYTVTYHMVSAEGRVDERSFTLDVRDR